MNSVSNNVGTYIFNQIDGSFYFENILLENDIL